MKKVRMKNRRITVRVLSLLTAVCLCVSFLASDNRSTVKTDTTAKANDIDAITKVDTDIDNDLSSYFDGNVTYKLPDTVSDNQEISVIVTMSTDSVMDAYEKSDKSLSVSEYS